MSQDEAVNPILDNLMIVQNAPASPGGTFQIQKSERLKTTYDPAFVSEPLALIATFAHELCHPLLLMIGDEPPGGAECEEFATDLAVAFFGFGLFGANSAFEFKQFQNVATGTQGWSTRRLGYLTEAEWGFALAVFLLLTDRTEKDISQFSKKSIFLSVKKSMRYIVKNRHVCDEIIR